ncbi:hypothetical protein BDV95DRAFT_598966 [Massariosphaeria phaeospora]|uniref:Uncharacterized protein n=1 Tax=Massariosphaeria phaeospora TaxID=100035 RepID=A0A7C8M361_9PLEO|nr:hypothetical protein BDV95DRAFT_598966 [Massariosphaeria phaeospora]
MQVLPPFVQYFGSADTTPHSVWLRALVYYLFLASGKVETIEDWVGLTSGLNDACASAAQRVTTVTGQAIQELGIAKRATPPSPYTNLPPPKRQQLDVDLEVPEKDSTPGSSTNQGYHSLRAQLDAAYTILETKNAELTAFNTSLTSKNTDLESKITNLHTINEELRTDLDRTQNQFEQMKKECDGLKMELASSGEWKNKYELMSAEMMREFQWRQSTEQIVVDERTQKLAAEKRAEAAEKKVSNAINETLAEETRADAAEWRVEAAEKRADVAEKKVQMVEKALKG